VVFGVVCGGNSNENENSAKSGISQDVHVTSPVQTAGRLTSSRCTNGCFEKMKEQRNIGPMREGLKSWKAKRKLVFESATDENKPPRKCQTRDLEVQFFKHCSCSHKKFGSLQI